MSVAPGEPEKYSIDEMMDRLKAKPEDPPLTAGELVTRADGTQAIRVRKRKRRSEQPHKETAKRARRALILQVSACLVVLLLSGLALGAAIIYANSAPYRENLARSIVSGSGAAAELRQFRMNPTSANAAELSLAWPAGNILRNLTLQTLHARISPTTFIGKSMSGEEVSARTGTLALRAPEPGQPLRATPAGKVSDPVNFTRFSVSKLNVTWGDPVAPVAKLTGTEASFYPKNVSGHPELRFTYGGLAIDGWPTLRMDRALVEFHDSEANVIGMRLLHHTDERGALELSGTALPYGGERRSSLAVHLESFLLDGLIGQDFGGVLTGRIDSIPTIKSNYLSFSSGNDPSGKLAISFRSSLTSRLQLDGLPFLRSLAQTLDDDWFERPMFDDQATGMLTRQDGAIRLGDLHFTSKGRMAVKGEISMAADKQLSGLLEIGVAEAMITAAPTKRLAGMFIPGGDGFRWITLKIGGSAAAPTDNFRALFDAAQAPPAVVPGESQKPRSTFEELTRPR